MSGAYKLKCKDCDRIYISKPGRNVNIRFKEHLKACKDGNIFSNVGDTCWIMDTHVK